MGHFNVLKGAHPDLNQIDAQLPVKSGTTGIVRGMALKRVLDGGKQYFDIAAAADKGDVNTPGAVPHFALRDQDSVDSKMAGKVNALSGLMPFEAETDQFADGESYVPGEGLEIADDGQLTPHTDDATCVGIITAAPYARWINNKLQPGGTRQGTKADVLSFQSCYIPQVSTSA